MKTLKHINNDIDRIRSDMGEFPISEQKTKKYRALKSDLESRLLIRNYLELNPNEDHIRKQYEDVKRIIDKVDSELKEMKDDIEVPMSLISKRRDDLYKIHSYKTKKIEKENLEYILEI